MKKINSLNPYPGAWFEFNGSRYKIWKALISEMKGVPGDILDEKLTIACGDRSIEVVKIQKEGKVEGANHIPRGMLEFWLDPESVYFKEGKLNFNKEMVLFCAGGLRSALAAKSLKDMGFEKVSHIKGGFGALRQSKFKIV